MATSSRINPFKPGYPVSPGMFVGRLQELERLEASLIQTRARNPCNFMISGERGIGKSSLLMYLKAVAEGHIPINREGEAVRFLVIDTDIDPNTTQLGLISKIELGLRKTLGNTEPARAFLREAWEFLKRVEAAGVTLRPDAKNDLDETVFEEFSYSLAETVNRVCFNTVDKMIFDTRFDGVLLLVDEADNGSKTLGLGSFFKLLTERLQRRGCNSFMVGLAGLPNLRDVLLNSHPSSLRLFEDNILERLSNNEVGRVIDMALDEANRTNAQKITINPDAREVLVEFSEGYPHFIQQFGSSAFEANSDDVITESDVLLGAYARRGALELIGDRYYRDNFYKKIQKESYRQILRIMADRLDGWVTKREIRDKFKGAGATLDNAIKALLDRHIILPKEGERGIYRLQHKGFALWIKLKSAESQMSLASPS